MKGVKCAPVLGLMLLVSSAVQAQSFGQVLLKGISQGLNNAANAIQQQNQQNRNSSNQFSLSNSRATNISGNSFRLDNSHAENIYKEITFNDGSKFYGALKDGRPYLGKMYYADGTLCEGTFDANGKMTGMCYIKYSDGSWYMGYFISGAKNGEGSYCDTDNNYYNVVYNRDNIVSSQKVASPKYRKTEIDPNAMSQFLEDLYRQEAQYAAPTTSGSSSSSGSKSRYSTSQIQRQADVTARAYEEYKKNPNATSQQYYQSNKRLLDTMQGR